jgi:DsbC/DsbD-like thiol-disulfide interchange protein
MVVCGMHKFFLPFAMSITPLLSQENGHATAELWLAAPIVREGSPTVIPAALRLVYEKGWHGYWINPGEGGMKTELRWKLPAGVKAGELQFPAPQREMTGELVNYSYSGEVLLPVTLTLEGGQKDHLPMELQVSWLACNDTKCAAGEATIQANLAKDAADDAKAAAVKRAFERLPVVDKALRLSVKESDGWVELVFSGADHLDLDGAEVFPVSEQALDPREAIVCRKADSTYLARVKKSEYASSALTSLELVLVPRNGAKPLQVDWKK